MKIRELLRGIVPAIGTLWLAPGAALAQTLPTPTTFAIVGARIEVGDGRIIAKGTVLIRDGVIAAVGASVAAPPEAEIIKGDGLIVYPGFIDGGTSSGLKLPDAQPDQDARPDAGVLVPTAMREANRKGVRPEVRAADWLALTESDLQTARKAGFTTRMIAPSGGMFNGVGALVNLSGLPPRDCLLLPETALDCAFKTPRGDGYPGTLLGVYAQFRQTLLDAQWYRQAQVAYDRGGPKRPPVDRVLEALQPVLHGERLALFEADSENEIDHVLLFSDQFGLHPMLSGGSFAWRRVDLLKQHPLPILLSLDFGPEPAEPPKEAPGPKPKAPEKPQATAPKPSAPEKGAASAPAKDAAKPTSDAETDDGDDTPPAVLAEKKRLYQERTANAAQLYRAGIPFGFTTRGVKSLDEFRQHLQKAVQAGLPKEAALRALTLDAARIWGVERHLGTVETGKLASLIVMSGDFSDPKSKVKYLLIDGKKFDTENDK